tara:strand:- start:435 stop:1070 length:636 start_codon:yes stop_codon:yes gene_type:complete
MHLYQFPSDICSEIIIFFDILDNYYFCNLNKVLYDLGKNNLIMLIKDKKKFIINRFPPVIFDLMNGIKTLIFTPILPFKDHFIGIDYIDGITVNDVSYPIMLGVDKYNRPFITIRTKCPDKCENSHWFTSVITIFQRFTNNKSIWTHGTMYSSSIIGKDDCPRIIVRDNLQCDTLKKNIHNLLHNKGYITYQDYDFKGNTYNETKIKTILF